MNLSEDIVKALGDYRKDIESGEFPAEENSFSMNEEELKKLREKIGS
jgi:3-methyl-2-oxobutanoate hydroxymethyltransferase